MRKKATRTKELQEGEVARVYEHWPRLQVCEEPQQVKLPPNPQHSWPGGQGEDLGGRRRTC